ncbi:MAG TPA: hypothetical protein ENK18_04175 [Deltaproteobacteria bacterium]|nr:hypothetical protein [Deltaproteobacteria bacterium]
MYGFWRTSRYLILAAGLACSLACAGAVEVIGDLAGLDIEMKLGDDAIHPADFPAKAIEGGTRSLYMAMTADADNLDLPPEANLELPSGVRYRMEMVVYELPAAEIPAAQARAETEVEAAGFTRRETEVEGDVGLGPFEQDGSLFAVLGAADRAAGDSALVLIRLIPVPDTPEG